LDETNQYFDLKQVHAITGDLRSLCIEMAKKLRECDALAAHDVGSALLSRQITAENFAEQFRVDVAHELMQGDVRFSRHH
jgi:hypothetical protein